MSEISTVRAIIKYLNKIPGCRAIKVHGGAYGKSGQPDVTGCILGRRFDFEVKVIGNKPTTKQLYEMDQWSKAGSEVRVIYSVNDAKSAIDSIMYKINKGD